MAFRFGLEALLRFRQSMERQEETRLQAANQKVRQVLAEIERCEQLERRFRVAQQDSLGEGLSGAELHFDTLRQSTLARRQDALQKERAHLEKLRDQQYQVFRQARTQREVLESLRNAQLHAYQEEKMRRDQRLLDDLFLMRREFLRRG
jgi:flagellar export protein FliJ